MFIETNRVVITEFERNMSESVYLGSLDEDTRRFVPDEVFETQNEAEEAVEQLIIAYKNPAGPFVYPILINNKKYIGYVQLLQLGDKWEVGYHISKDYTGRGYATEALRAFLPVVMAQLDIKTVYGICHGENIASQKVLEKCGFVLGYRGISEYQNETTEICRYTFKGEFGPHA
ncbi:Protein N-acetyltransferase, RimJ/RimL family [Alkalibacterium subtropicum]|uniref:Protein N-acetyltransferase, RimJ/RimL family n=1 Tax=Alkalibacterium subtropicum TaxID=753702 RepID=A0A1I1HHI3_9LACT|nr:GNAT family N-acetyltransferase [Alkalibacterium subtropicum]SFC23301.1 Protein N-acetyltransferase, RimJ/RimL family [Alkalibacterium subtropicum]